MGVEKECHSLDTHAWCRPLPISPAVRAGDLVFVAGQSSLNEKLEIVAPGDVREQMRRALGSVARLVQRAGGTLDDVIDVVSYHRDAREIDQALEVASEFFSRDYPAWTPVATVGTLAPGALVTVRAIAHVGNASKECYASDHTKWRRAYPVSEACRKGNVLFIAGQTAAANDGSVAEPLEHVSQARSAYERIRELLGRGGGSIDDALDFSSFHQDIRGAEPTLVDVYMREVLPRGTHSGIAPTTSHLGMPALHKRGMLGTYRVLADLSPGARVSYTPDSIWWKHVFPIGGGARKEGGALLTIAGQVACAPDASIVRPGDVAGQARYVLDCMREILEEAGGSLANIVELTSFHKEPRAWEEVMRIAVNGYFDPASAPAWTVVGSSGLWMEGYLHEISAIPVL